MIQTLTRSVFALALLLAVAPAFATWSIIAIDTRTGEIAVGSATCLLNFDLKRGLPVVRPMVGAAAAQSMIDAGAVNRLKIWNELALGTPPDEILALLAAGDSQHQRRQYGIVDVRGRATTFTGSLCGPHASGTIGAEGTLVYAIQGNVITGAAVVSAAETALLTEPGGLPEKLMAAMEAARAFGGDGRCSCSGTQPDSCGAPPPNFDPNNPQHKSAHIGFMLVARDGDAEGICSSPSGCANGAYYMVFNILASSGSQPDPVVQLRQKFNEWKVEIIGQPDALESTATFSAPVVLNQPGTPVDMLIELRDWQGNPATTTVDLAVEHAPGSAASCEIGLPEPLGGGLWRVPLVVGATAGIDRFRVEAAYGFVTRVLMPRPQLLVQDQRADLNQDGVVDLTDLAILLKAYMKSAGGDVDGDGQTSQSDLALLLSSLEPGE